MSLLRWTLWRPPVQTIGTTLCTLKNFPSLDRDFAGGFDRNMKGVTRLLKDLDGNFLTYGYIFA